MSKGLKGVLIFAIVSICRVNAQDIAPSISNILKYGNGRKLYGNTKGIPQTYLENLADLRLGLPSGFAIGMRYLHDDPPEIGPTFIGIQRRYLEYAGDRF